jgi:hypothetical protein
VQIAMCVQALLGDAIAKKYPAIMRRKNNDSSNARREDSLQDSEGTQCDEEVFDHRFHS